MKAHEGGKKSHLKKERREGTPQCALISELGKGEKKTRKGEERKKVAPFPLRSQGGKENPSHKTFLKEGGVQGKGENLLSHFTPAPCMAASKKKKIPQGKKGKGEEVRSLLFILFPYCEPQGKEKQKKKKREKEQVHE